MTAALSNALTRSDVAEAVVSGLCEALDADGTSLGIVLEERAVLRTLAWKGLPDELFEGGAETPLDDDVFQAEAVSRRTPTFYASFEELRARFPDVATEDLAGHESLLLVPLVAERRVIGLLTASWAEARVRDLTRWAGGAGARARRPLRVGADDRRDAPTQRPSDDPPAGAGRAARLALPAGNG
jgi:transcriptional regulator with GAF, ATPase, and Fis domain